MSSEQEQEQEQPQEHQEQEEQQQQQEEAEQGQDVRPTKWFVSLRRGHELSGGEKDQLRTSLRRNIFPWEIPSPSHRDDDRRRREERQQHETPEYVYLIEEIVRNTSDGIIPCAISRKLMDENFCSNDTVEDIDYCVRDFFAELAVATDNDRFNNISVRRTTRLQDHLRDLNIDRDAEYDIDDVDEYEIVCDDMGEVPRALSWDGFAALFDLYFGYVNKILWVTPDAFAYVGMHNDVFGRYALKLTVQDDYMVYGHIDAMASANRFSDIMVRMVSRDRDRDHVRLQGMQRTSPLSLQPDLLEKVWDPAICPSREVSVCGFTMTPEQTLALVRPRHENFQAKRLLIQLCHFQDGGHAFFDCIRNHNTPATMAFIQNPSIRHGGLLQFAAAVSVNVSLQRLTFRDQFLTPPEISALVVAMRANRTLKSVKLETGRNWCREHHWPQFCELVSIHPSLQAISLECQSREEEEEEEEEQRQTAGRRATADWTKMVADAVARSNTLETLELLRIEYDRSIYESRIEPALAVNAYRRSAISKGSDGASRGTSSSSSRWSQALFGRALAALSSKKHGSDLLNYALVGNIHHIIVAPYSSREEEKISTTRTTRPAPHETMIAGSISSRRRKTCNNKDESKKQEPLQEKVLLEKRESIWSE